MFERIIIQKAKNKDKWAMEQLYRVHFKALYIFVRAKVNTNERAEDIVSESFIKAFEKIKTFQEKSTFKSWLFTIAKNLVYDWYAKKEWNLKDELEETIEDSTLAKEELNVTSSEEINLKPLLESLAENHREVLELRFLGNLSIKETALVMNTTEGNVKILQNRAIKKAREIINKLNLKF